MVAALAGRHCEHLGFHLLLRRMTSPAASPPAPRVASRIASQFLLRCLRRIGACVEGNLKLGVAFLTIAQATCNSSPQYETDCTAGIRAMSAAMRIPYETMRRYVGALVRSGLCERSAKGGVAVASTVAARQTVAQMRRMVLDQYLLMQEELEEVGFDFSRIRTGSDCFAGEDERMAFLTNAACNFYLRLLEVNSPVFDGDVTMLAVWTALMCENRSHITCDRVLTWKYGMSEMPIPDKLLRPVSVLAVSQSLGMPFETTRRHLARLLRDQLCVRVKRTGLLAPENIARKNRASQIKSLTALRLIQSLAELGAAGFHLPVRLVQGAVGAAGQGESPADRHAT
jgi:hypothetical protein